MLNKLHKITLSYLHKIAESDHVVRETDHPKFCHRFVQMKKYCIYSESVMYCICILCSVFIMSS